MNRPHISLPHQNRTIASIMNEVKANRQIAKALTSSFLAKEEERGEKFEVSPEKDINDPKDFKRIGKNIGIGWTVVFRYGRRERNGHILSVNNRGLVVSVSFLGGNHKMKSERITVKCQQIVEIFKK